MNHDDLTQLPHIGPNTEKELKDAGYTTYDSLATEKPYHLYTLISTLGLSETPQIINHAVKNIDHSCPICDSKHTLRPIWGGYSGTLSKHQKQQYDFFCDDCGWTGTHQDLTKTHTSKPTVSTAEL